MAAGLLNKGDFVKVKCNWINKLQLVATMDKHSIVMDAKEPLGENSAPTPKELLLAALCGCTAMDVAAMMGKYRQPLEQLTIEADAAVHTATPAIFTAINLVYKFIGKIDQERAIEAVKLSESKYCSVSAMLFQSVPILYIVNINGEDVANGRADFELPTGSSIAAG